MKPRQLLNRSLNAASFIMTFHHQCAATVCSHKLPYSVGSMVLGKNLTTIQSTLKLTLLLINLSKDTSMVLF